MFFSGTPLLSDPGSLLFYFPNVIFLFLPTDSAFIVSFVLHTFLGGLGTYLTAKKGFGFSKIASVITAIFYITFPRTAGFLEAGHFVFVIMTAWLPFVLLATIKLIKSPNFFWSVFLAVSLAGLFFSFPTIFVLVVAATSAVLLVGGSYILIKTHSPKILVFLFLSIALIVGITANTFFPQVEWLPQTTRFILLEDRDVYPKWNGKAEFIKALYPQFSGQKLYELDTEKWLAVGIFISVLSLIGFYKLKKTHKIFIFLLALATILISLNNVSPLEPLLTSSDWYVLGRVATRIWFINVLIFVFLAGFGLESIRKAGFPKFSTALTILTIVELITLSWVWIEKPKSLQRESVPTSLFEFLKSDSETFRVFCTTRCLSQKDVAQNNIQTIEGYGTVYQKNYYDYFIQLSQVYWDKYAATLPPIPVYKFSKIQPLASTLGDHNVKYVISPYSLKDPNFKLAGQFGEFLVYENPLVKSRAYFYARGTKSEIEAPMLHYSPNKIIIDTSKYKASEIILAETWSPGWMAKNDMGTRIKVSEAANKLIKVKLEKGTHFIELYYYPETHRLGKTISIFTFIVIISYFILHLFSRKENLDRTGK